MGLYERGDLPEAEKLQREVLDASLQVHGAMHPSTLAAKNNLAETLYERGDLPHAEKLQREVRDARLQVLGAMHPGTLKAESNLADIWRMLGDVLEAEKLHRRPPRVQHLGQQLAHMQQWQ